MYLFLYYVYHFATYFDKDSLEIKFSGFSKRYIFFMVVSPEMVKHGFESERGNFLNFGRLKYLET